MDGTGPGPLTNAVSRWLMLVVGLTVLTGSALLTGCASVDTLTPADGPVVASASARPSSSPSTAGSPTAVPSVQVGRSAKTDRVRYVPTKVTLPGGAQAPVVPAKTVDGELQVPHEVKHVGWWDGSAQVGDPYGATVIAGHVDSATEGLGFFARLLQIKVGDVVSVGGDGHSQRYRIRSVGLVSKQALAADSEAFDQTGTPRLVLITCAGQYHRDRGGYDSNLIVIGSPLS